MLTTGEPVKVFAYKTPKQTLLAVIKAGVAKGKLPWWQVAVLGFMAGAYIAIGGLLSILVAGGITGKEDIAGPSSTGAQKNSGLVKLLAGSVFPFGLMLVVIAGAELFTGNVMYIFAAYIERKVTLKEMMRNFVVSYIFNFIGAVAFAYLLAYVPQMVHSEPHLTYVQKLAWSKNNAGWGRLIFRGIGCNWMVCIGLWSNLASEDIVSKIVAIWWPVMAFVAIGYDHAVANMFFVPLGLMEGADTTFGRFIGENLIPVTIGNIIGAALLVVGAEWAAYSEYFGEAAKTIETKPGHKPAKGNGAISPMAVAAIVQALSPRSAEMAQMGSASSNPRKQQDQLGNSLVVDMATPTLDEHPNTHGTKH